MATFAASKQEEVIMEDIFQVLLIIGFIAIGVFRQINKEKSPKNTDSEIPMPIPAPTVSGPYPQQKSPETKKPANSRKKQITSPIEEGVRTTHVPPPISTPPQSPAPTEAAEKSEYSIDSPEDARRAIIWSEILQRKY